MKNKKIYITVLAGIMALAMGVAGKFIMQTVKTADAATIVESGTWKGIDWTLDSDGTLTLSGTQTEDINLYDKGSSQTYSFLSLTVGRSPSVSEDKKISGGLSPDFQTCYSETPWTSGSVVSIIDRHVSNGYSLNGIFAGLTNCETYATEAPFSTSGTANFAGMFLNDKAMTSIQTNMLDVSDAVNLISMFESCKALEALDVSGFNTTPKAKAYKNMFCTCSTIKALDVSGFNMANVTDLTAMFRFCSSMETISGLSLWDVGNVTYTEYLFNQCKLLTAIDISAWVPSKLMRAKSMFSYAESLETLDATVFNVSPLTDISSMFNNCKKLASLDVSGWETGAVTKMNSTFSGMQSITELRIDSWDVSRVNDFSRMFQNCGIKGITFDFSRWNTSSATTMGYMFSGAGCTILDVSNFDVSHLTAKPGSIFGSSSLKELVTFPNTSAYNIDLPSCPMWQDDDYDGIPDQDALGHDLLTAGYTYSSPTWETNKDQIKTGDPIHHYASLYPTFLYGSIYDTGYGSNIALEVNKFFGEGTSKIITEFRYSSEPFTSEYTLQSYGDPIYCRLSGTVLEVYTETGKIYLNRSCEGLFQNLTAVEVIDLSHFYIERLLDITYMFSNCQALTEVINLDLLQCDRTGMSVVWGGTFEFCTSLTNLVWHCNMQGLSSMDNMFRGCTNLESVEGLYNVNPSSCDETFAMCPKLKSVEGLENWDTSKVNSMDYTFCGAGFESLDLKAWDTSKVTSLYGTFANMSSLVSLDVSTWDVSAVKSMAICFYNIPNLTSLSIENWNPSAVKNIGAMFACSTKLTELDMATWNTPALTSLHATAFTVKPKLTDTGLYYSSQSAPGAHANISPFYGCTKLEVIDMHNWDLSQATTMNGLFSGCNSLLIIDMSNADITNIADSVFQVPSSVYKIVAPKTIISSQAITLPSEVYAWYIDDDGDLVADSATKYTQLQNDIADESHTYYRRDYPGFSLPIITTILETGSNVNSALAGILNSSVTSLAYTDTAWDNYAASPNIALPTYEPVYISRQPVYQADTSNKQYAHTTNINNSGVRSGNYSNNVNSRTYPTSNSSSSNNRKITFSGSGIDHLHIELTYATESSYDYIHILKGTSYSSYPQNASGNANCIASYSGNAGTPVTIELDVPGNAVTFAFYSDSSTNDYGYYAVVYPVRKTGECIAVYSEADVICSNPDSSDMFKDLATIADFDLTWFDTSLTTDMSAMFKNCASLSDEDIEDVEDFNMSRVTDISEMFSGCTSITSLDLGKWDIPSLTDAANIVAGCTGLTGIYTLKDIPVGQHISLPSGFYEHDWQDLDADHKQWYFYDADTDTWSFPDTVNLNYLQNVFFLQGNTHEGTYTDEEWQLLYDEAQNTLTALCSTKNEMTAKRYMSKTPDYNYLLAREIARFAEAHNTKEFFHYTDAKWTTYTTAITNLLLGGNSLPERTVNVADGNGYENEFTNFLVLKDSVTDPQAAYNAIIAAKPSASDYISYHYTVESPDQVILLYDIDEDSYKNEWQVILSNVALADAKDFIEVTCNKIGESSSDKPALTLTSENVSAGLKAKLKPWMKHPNDLEAYNVAMDELGLPFVITAASGNTSINMLTFAFPSLDEDEGALAYTFDISYTLQREGVSVRTHNTRLTK